MARGSGALVEAVHLSWWSVLFILVFWALVSYLTLPRLHRIRIYVPAYFFSSAVPRPATGCSGTR